MGEDTRKVLVGSIHKVNTYHTDAYAVAVRNGFEGTEEEWLASLSAPALQALAECHRAEVEREKAENKREAQEAVREQAESVRAEAFNAEVQGRAVEFAEEQNDREEAFAAEALERKTTFEKAETERATSFAAENRARATEFAESEQERANTFNAKEQARDNAFAASEAGRSEDFAAANNERQRTFQQAETARQTAENSRASAESDRVTAETARASAENARKSGESARASAETARENAEQTRDSNEAARVAAETVRAEEFAAWGDIIAGVEQYDSRISRNDKRITNLEQGLMADAYETDASVAYAKNVPANALPYAGVAKVGGMTYKDGDTLKNAKVTEIESVGVNLVPIERRTHTTNGITFVVNKDGSVTANGTATGNAYLNFNKPFYITSGVYCIKSGATGNSDNTYAAQLYEVLDGGGTKVFVSSVKDNGVSFEVSNSIKAVGYIVIRTGVTVSNLTFYPMLNKGSTALPYTPYVKHTLPIPEAVQALEGYGDGVNESVYNYIDYEKKQFVKRVGVVDMGTLAWVVVGDRFRSSTFNIKHPGTSEDRRTGFLCDRYAVSTNANATLLDDKSMIRYDDGLLFLKDSDYTDAATLNAAMSGVMLYYELAEPIITDISDILPADNLLEVEGGGTVTSVNEYKYDVPTEIIYQMKQTEEV